MSNDLEDLISGQPDSSLDAAFHQDDLEDYSRPQSKLLLLRFEDGSKAWHRLEDLESDAESDGDSDAASSQAASEASEESEEEKSPFARNGEVCTS